MSDLKLSYSETLMDRHKCVRQDSSHENGRANHHYETTYRFVIPEHTPTSPRQPGVQIIASQLREPTELDHGNMNKAGQENGQHEPKRLKDTKHKIVSLERAS